MISARTNNKITFCQNCIGVLTPVNDRFCNDACQSKKAEAQSTRDLSPSQYEGGKKIWVYLNKNMLDIAKSNGIIPHEFSYFIYTGYELAGVACYDTDDLIGAAAKIGDHEAIAYDAWWREIGSLNVSFEPHHPLVMREEGLRSYLCDHFGISTERNVACAIGELTHLEGLKSPIEFINSL